MKKMVILVVTAVIFGVCFFGFKLTPKAAVIFDDETFEEEVEEASEVAEEIAEETVEETVEEPEIEVFIDIEDPEIEEEPEVPTQEENKKGLIPENETPETVEEQEETKAKGLIPEETAGEVKGSVVVPVDGQDTVEARHDGVKPMDTNTTADGKTAFCIEEQEQHPDYSGTDYVIVDNAEDVNKYDHIVVGYTEAVNRGENKTLCDRAAQAAIWDLNGSQDDQETLLSDSHEGQEKEDVLRLYNEFKNHEAVDHSKWKITYTTLAPTETSEFGNYQNLITFEAVEIKEDKPEIPEKKVPEQPEETPEFYPLDEEVPETGDSHLPVAPFAAVGLLSAIAIVGYACRKNAR
jgi:hypothetical protein